MKIKVSIIIPTYKDWARLKLCLKALQEQTFSQDNFEIIVVNNDTQTDLPQNYPLPHNCILLHEKNPGSYAARNSALKISRGEIIGFTDSDCIPEKDWIENAVVRMTNDRSIDRLAGPIKIFTRHKEPSAVEYYDVIYAFHQEKYVERGVAATANLFTYKRLFEAVGFFNEKTMSGGDFQWGLEANRAGYNIAYAEDVVVNHPARNSVRALVKKAQRTGAGEAVTKTERKNAATIVKDLLQIIRPKTWEIKLIFCRAEELNFFQKVYLICLRHYILWTSDFFRIKTGLIKR